MKGFGQQFKSMVVGMILEILDDVETVIYIDTDGL